MRHEPAHPELLADPFANWTAVDIGGVAASLTWAALQPIAYPIEALAGISDAVPEIVPDEVSETFELMTYPRTIRVTTDCSWLMEGA